VALIKSERKTTKRLGGFGRPGSGAVEGAKGDIMLTEFLIENKCTEHRSISLKADWLDKISREARAEGKAPGLAIQFVDRQGNSNRGNRWVMITEDEFYELLEKSDR
jgi:hypothetical protein